MNSWVLFTIIPNAPHAEQKQMFVRETINTTLGGFFGSSKPPLHILCFNSSVYLTIITSLPFSQGKKQQMFVQKHHWNAWIKTAGFCETPKTKYCGLHSFHVCNVQKASIAQDQDFFCFPDIWTRWHGRGVGINFCLIAPGFLILRYCQCGVSVCVLFLSLPYFFLVSSQKKKKHTHHMLRYGLATPWMSVRVYRRIKHHPGNMGISCKRSRDSLGIPRTMMIRMKLKGGDWLNKWIIFEAGCEKMSSYDTSFKKVKR